METVIGNIVVYSIIMYIEKFMSAIWLACLLSATLAFQPLIHQQHATSIHHSSSTITSTRKQSTLLSATKEDDIATIQILMSDTGGGHRASANALRDAFNVLHETEPNRFPIPIHCDIVDIYTDYGPFFPYNQYVGLYKIMAEYDFLWKW